MAAKPARRLPKRGPGASRCQPTHPAERPSTGRGWRPEAPGRLRPRPPAARARERQPAHASTSQAVLGLYRPDLAKILAGADAAPYRYGQVLAHLLRRPLYPFGDASALPADVRVELDKAGASVLDLTAIRRAADGTTKLLLEAADGARVEAVLMSYGSRVTACLSSQVGCAVGCAFCATGAMGFRRNLSAAEIVDQLRASISVMESGQRITNVVYMGMGEPLLNLGAVLDSIQVLTYPGGMGFGHRSLSVSTVGIPAGIVRLARAEPQVNLALSLHAADDATRALLIPESFRHPLTEVLAAAWEHFSITGRKLLLEYVLLAGVNDSVDDARRLAGLLRGHVVTVNLLAWNPVCPKEAEPTGPGDGVLRKHAHRTAHGRTRPRSGGQDLGTTSRLASVGPSSLAGSPSRVSQFQPSPPGAIAAFRSTLRAAHIEAVVRQSKGIGIEAACGQLAASQRSYAAGDGDAQDA